MMANAVEMQQLLMSMDPSSTNQFNAMNKGGACVLTTTSGGSASPTSSSGAPSSSSLTGEIDEKDQMQSQMLQNGMTTAGLGGSAWLSMLLQQQNMADPKLKPVPTDIAEMVQNPQQMIDLLNSSGDISKFAAQLAMHNKTHEMETDEQREQSSSPPPAVSLNSSLAAIMLPTTSTSTGCSAASTTSSVDSTGSSVIVNGAVGGGGVTGLEEEEMMPPAKKSKTEEETPVTPTSTSSQLMQTLLAQIGLNNSMQQANQKQMKDELLFGGLFPQSLANLPLVFPSPLHQQFSGMQDFDGVSALSTPNKQNGGVKRQYSSNGKNYCDICNKEVCNKYFLRTHMLKMHGIVIDENKTVIANIDTLVKERDGELSFRCDTCRTMFKTRNQLRQHRQDVHGVLPLSTPRNNQNKPSLPSTPTANNNSAPNSATSLDEKCQMCDKRVVPGLMVAHMAQEHFGMTGNGTPDLTQIMALMGQAAARIEKEDQGIMDCSECSYKTRDQKNLELHLERHHKMNEAKQRDEEEDVALKMTTEAALQMVVQNQTQFEGDSTAAALNLTFKNDGVKKEVEEEKAVGTQHERNSHTSGSLSPSGSIPEGYGKALGDKVFPTQTFLVRSNDQSGCFLTEFLAQLPVRSMVNGPRQIVFDLVPTPTTNAV